jgi:hypothetical protein
LVGTQKNVAAQILDLQLFDQLCETFGLMVRRFHASILAEAGEPRAVMDAEVL